ncbi:hypothetical protein PYCCODRAFT_1472751 [Trametes coccinea BRFM310]|uniref:Uncharacterized protein n=1 Tax=Trametes coccinea (strain BRFM310) TaxID=1353009 RepID=A0A1Y2I576_TRAC3|nr:hypothetical protein PYCCODRAFT_1472751 [Trametes coccinea BRFM310]
MLTVSIERALEDGDGKFIDDESTESEEEEPQTKKPKKVTKGKGKATDEANEAVKKGGKAAEGSARKPINPGKKPKSKAALSHRKSILTGVRPPRKDAPPINPQEEARSAQQFKEALERMDCEERDAPRSPPLPDFDTGERFSLPPSPSLPSSLGIPAGPPQPSTVPPLPRLPPLPLSGGGTPSVPARNQTNPNSSIARTEATMTMGPSFTPATHPHEQLVPTQPASLPQIETSGSHPQSDSMEVDRSASMGVSDSSKRQHRDSSPLSSLPSDSDSAPETRSENEAPLAKRPRLNTASSSSSRKPSRKPIDQASALGLRKGSRHTGLSSLPAAGSSSKGKANTKSSTAGASSGGKLVGSNKSGQTSKAPTEPRSHRG